MDRRVKYTKKVIKDTFINLLNTKEINKITVSEICTIADINRATFYRYYIDIYDLLDQIKNEFVTELKTASIENESNSVAEFTKDLLKTFLNNKELAQVLFQNKQATYFLNDILEIIYKKCKNIWKKDLPNIKEEDIEYATVFIFNGALGIINFWIKNDFDKSVDEISNTIETLSYYGITKYIYKKNV